MRAVLQTLLTALILCTCGRASAAAPLTLHDLMEKARNNDSRVEEAEAELRRLQALRREAWWAWFPKFESYAAVGGPTPEAKNDGLGGPPLTEATKMYDLNFGEPGVMMRIEMNAFVPLFTFGKLEALNTAARMGVKVGESLKERARNEAAFQAAQAFFGYQLSRQGKATLEETQVRLQDAEEMIRGLLDQESTQVTTMDLYKVQYFKRQVDAQLAQAVTGRELALTALRLLTGTPRDAALEIAPRDLEEPSLQLLPIDDYQAQALERRPELRAVEAGIRARDQEVQIRRRLYYPDFGLAGFFRWMYTTSATRQLSPFAYDPYNDLSGGVAFVARATFDFPIKNAQLEQAEAELQKLVARKKQVISLVRLEVRQAYGALQEALGRARAQEEAERNARRWATAAFASFEIGATDTRELTDAFTALALASAEKLKAWHDAQIGVEALSRAVGRDLRLHPVPAAGPAPAPAEGE